MKSIRKMNRLQRIVYLLSGSLLVFGTASAPDSKKSTPTPTPVEIGIAIEGANVYVPSPQGDKQFPIVPGSEIEIIGPGRSPNEVRARVQTDHGQEEGFVPLGQWTSPPPLITVERNLPWVDLPPQVQLCVINGPIDVYDRPNGRVKYPKALPNGTKVDVYHDPEGPIVYYDEDGDPWYRIFVDVNKPGGRENKYLDGLWVPAKDEGKRLAYEAKLGISLSDAIAHSIEIGRKKQEYRKSLLEAARRGDPEARRRLEDEMRREFEEIIPFVIMVSTPLSVSYDNLVEETLKVYKPHVSPQYRNYLRFALEHYDELVLVREYGDKAALARKYGVSWGTVHRALKALEEVGLYEPWK